MRMYVTIPETYAKALSEIAFVEHRFPKGQAEWFIIKGIEHAIEEYARRNGGDPAVLLYDPDALRELADLPPPVVAKEPA